MKSFKVWGPIAIAIVLLLSVFQNCSPVSFKDVEETAAKMESTALPTTRKSCDLEKRFDGDTWMSAAGQEREVVQCEVGTGNQFDIFDVSKEYRCDNGEAVLTGKIVKTPAGREGLCNLDCGNHKNLETWWTDMATSVEMVQCPTSTTVQSTVTYQNSAQYMCKDAISSLTGKTDKKQISATECPALTFNDQNDQATLTFEDLYPAAGDSDYNDFVTNIKVAETYSNLGELTKIVIEYKGKYIAAGLLHKLILVFDGTVRGRDGWVSNQNFYTSAPMFNGPASINYELFNGETQLKQASVAKNADLVVFENTREAAKGLVARITVTNIDGKQNLLSTRKNLAMIKRYRTLLYIPNSSGYSTVKTYDIDVSDINPTSYDSKGNPLAFFVPVDWRPPTPETNIALAYPDFHLHADFVKASIAKPELIESDKAKTWFNNVVLSKVIPL
jgi:hypothetical protein